MPRITGEDIRYKLEEIDNTLRNKYKLEHPKKERDWITYEQEFSTRIKLAMKELNPLIDEAVTSIKIIHGPGHPHSLSLDQRVKLLLIKQLVGESNRMFANMLAIFSMLSGIDISYKTVERLYSDDQVILAIHNLHVLILKRKGITNSDATGDGTGYSLTVKKNYESHAQKLKDMAKENPDHGKDAKKSKIHKKRLFAYSFALMDLESRLYIAFGSSMKSEREAYDRAKIILMDYEGKGVNAIARELDTNRTRVIPCNRQGHLLWCGQSAERLTGQGKKQNNWRRCKILYYQERMLKAFRTWIYIRGVDKPIIDRIDQEEGP